jgi:hypothetical protein
MSQPRYREFSARVPADDYDEFVKLTDGVYGATTWFINSCLKQFITQERNNPSPSEKIKEAISQILEERKDEARAV